MLVDGLFIYGFYLWKEEALRKADLAELNYKGVCGNEKLKKG